jgi:hypothetical protein
MTVPQQTTDTNEMTTLTYPTDLTHPFFNGKTNADIETLHAIINTATPFTADEPADEWENDELCLELNHGFCVMEGRHADTNDADWELFIRATETDEYTEELYVELQTRLAARTDDESDCSDGRDRDDDEMSECEECGERYLLGEFNVVESEMKQYCYCDDCFATKIKDGEVIKNPEEDDEWIFQNDD